MLGLILATNGLSSKVVLTEASEVMSSLRENVDRNVTDDKAHNLLSGNDTVLHSKGIHGTIYKPACPKHRVSVRQLRWDHLKADIKSSADSSKDDTPQYMTSHDLEPHSFDTIVDSWNGCGLFSIISVSTLTNNIQNGEKEAIQVHEKRR